MASISQKNFAAGELPPALHARCDTAKYQAGARTMRNMLVMRTGGATNRAGTSIVGEVRDSSKPVRLIPFVFSETQAFVLEFGNNFMRVVGGGSLVTMSPTFVSAITKANPAVVTTSSAHGYSTGDQVQFGLVAGGSGMPEVEGRTFSITVLTTTTFSLQNLDSTNVNSTGFGTYVSGIVCQRIYTLGLPVAQSALADMQYAQSADVLSLAASNLSPINIARTGTTSWTVTPFVSASSIAPPASITVTGSAGAGSQSYSFAATAISDATSEESLPVISSVVTAGDPANLPWDIAFPVVSGASGYNVYRNLSGVYGFVGAAYAASGTVHFTYNSNAITPTTNPPRSATLPLTPGALGYYQQRRLYGGFPTQPSTVYASMTGAYQNYFKPAPMLDDSPVSFTLVGRTVHEVRHFVDMGALLVFTNAGVWVVEGNGAGVLTPSGVNPRLYSTTGSSRRQPIPIGNSVVYVQTQGSAVYDLGYDFSVKGFDGDEISVTGAHLVDGFTIVDWAYQKRPNSIIWAVRSDGVLLGLTYIRKQEIIAWHRHDTDGFVENVCCIPENGEDVLYLTVRRTINGQTKRFIERMDSRFFTDIRDAKFLDCSISYDGRNANSGTFVTLTGGSAWATSETLTLTASGSLETPLFIASDVGSQVQLTGADGATVRLTITGYTSGSVVTGTPDATVPVSLQGTATATFTKAIKTVRGAWHLEGKQVSVIADGFVIASPNNPKYPVMTVTNGSLTFDRCYGVIRVGLPITADLETLDIDNPDTPLSDKPKLISAVNLHLEKTRGVFVGGVKPADNSTTGLVEQRPRRVEPFGTPNSLITGKLEVAIEGHWNSNGRVFLRQVDPLPMTILAIEPCGLIPGRN